VSINRRQFSATMIAAASLPVLRPISRAFAQSPAPTVTTPPAASAPPTASASNPWQQLSALSARASDLGLSVPRMSPGITLGTSFDEVMPAVVDFIDSVKASAAGSNVPQSQIDDLINSASSLLSDLQNKERAPRSEASPAELGVAPVSFDAIKDQYIELFNSCVPLASHRTQIAWYVGKLTDPDYDRQYQQVEESVCVPWYFVGLIHAMEASFNFNAHLHNGDPLDRKTVHVPAGRPPVWLPPSDWASSADDAMKYEGFADQTDWSLARLLYRLEAYNGFGSRAHGINTPYLWSFSNHYSKGKYVSDGVWDASAVSQQCGAAVMLKAMVTAGKVTIPT